MGVSQVSKNFVVSIPEPLKEEKVISIRARVIPNAVRFAINLVCSNKDIAFHFNPRFEKPNPVVVCNSFTKTCWGQEERLYSWRGPFQEGETFEMTITVKSDRYEVSVNGNHFLSYEHRLPYHTVKELHFREDVSFEGVSYSSARDPPSYCPSPQVDSEATEMGIGDPKQNPV